MPRSPVSHIRHLKEVVARRVCRSGAAYLTSARFCVSGVWWMSACVGDRSYPTWRVPTDNRHAGALRLHGRGVPVTCKSEGWPIKRGAPTTRQQSCNRSLSFSLPLEPLPVNLTRHFRPSRLACSRRSYTCSTAGRCTLACSSAGRACRLFGTVTQMLCGVAPKHSHAPKQS